MASAVAVAAIRRPYLPSRLAKALQANQVDASSVPDLAATTTEPPLTLVGPSDAATDVGVELSNSTPRPKAKRKGTALPTPSGGLIPFVAVPEVSPRKRGAKRRHTDSDADADEKKVVTKKVRQGTKGVKNFLTTDGVEVVQKLDGGIASINLGGKSVTEMTSVDLQMVPFLANKVRAVDFVRCWRLTPNPVLS